MPNGSYNPDVLSCLANLSNDEVFTSPTLVNEILDLLPKELWSNEKATFLDPCTKSGAFLREITKRLIDGLKVKIPNLQNRIDHILHKQVFGIALTELTSLLSRRSLYCSKYPNCRFSISYFDSSSGNIRYQRINHTWVQKTCIYCGATKNKYDRNEQLENYAYEFIHSDNPGGIFPMKFDVIIGNPPYQLNDGGGTGSSAKPIYQKFIYTALKLNPKYLTMIIPSRWFTGGKGLDEFRKMMITNRHFQILHDFVNAKDCFPGINLEGGACYFLINNNYSGTCKIFTHQQTGDIYESNRYLDGNGKYDIFIRDEKVLKIVEQVAKKNLKPFNSLVTPRNPFSLSNSTKFLKEETDLLRVLGRFSSQRDYRFIDCKTITKNLDFVGKYKLFVSKADGAAGQIGNPIPARIIGKPVIGEKYDVCTETFLAIGPFESKNVTENIQQYMQTKFFRFLVGARKNKNMTQNTYRFVPCMDFSKKWDDKELFAFFDLSKEQIEYIDKMISSADSLEYSSLETVDDDDE